MDASVGHELFSWAALWGGCLGLAGTGFVLLGVVFAHVPDRLRVAVRRYGLSAVLVFGGFAAVATISAQKEETVDFRDLHGLGEGVSTNQHESARISIRENSCQFVDKAPTGEETPCLPSSVSSVSSDSNSTTPGYTLSRIGTNEAFSFVPPEGAVIAEIWRRRGAATDWMRLSFGGWEFPFGDAAFSSLVVFANGTILLSTNAVLKPVTASLGLVPAANWGRLAESNRPSLFWHGMRDDGSLLLTWQNALLHRATTNPVSFQVELSPNGNFAYRYDLSRLASDDILTNVFAAVVAEEGKRKKEEGKSAEGQISFLLSRATTSLAFRSDSERRCDAARDDFEERLGDLDPLACPSGSTNTVWEHLVYTGTTNGAFAHPQPTERTAVLRVTVVGAGRGELLVGSHAVPLVGERSATLNTEGMEGRRHGEGVLDRIDKIDGVETGSSNPVNPVNLTVAVEAAQRRLQPLFAVVWSVATSSPLG